MCCNIKVQKDRIENCNDIYSSGNISTIYVDTRGNLWRYYDCESGKFTGELSKDDFSFNIIL